MNNSCSVRPPYERSADFNSAQENLQFNKEETVVAQIVANEWSV